MRQQPDPSFEVRLSVSLRTPGVRVEFENIMQGQPQMKRNVETNLHVSKFIFLNLRSKLALKSIDFGYRKSAAFSK